MAVNISPRNDQDMASSDDISSSDDFDFSISREISVQDSSPAGEIFSDGKLLPLSSIPLTATSVNIALQQYRQNDLENIDDRKSKVSNNLEEMPSVKKSSAAGSSRPQSSSFWSSTGRSRSAMSSPLLFVLHLCLDHLAPQVSCLVYWFRQVSMPAAKHGYDT